MKWVRSGDYDRIMSGEYRKRGDEGRRARGGRRRRPTTTPRSSATIFEEAGEGVSKAGDKAGDAADKLSDWLKQR